MADTFTFGMHNELKYFKESKLFQNLSVLLRTKVTSILNGIMLAYKYQKINLVGFLISSNHLQFPNTLITENMLMTISQQYFKYTKFV